MVNTILGSVFLGSRAKHVNTDELCSSTNFHYKRCNLILWNRSLVSPGKHREKKEEKKKGKKERKEKPHSVGMKMPESPRD